MGILKKLLGAGGSSADWRAEIAKLEVEVAAAESQRQALTRERAAAALSALAEDAQAKRTVMRIDGELSTLEAKAQTISDGLAEARARLQEATAAEAAQTETNRQAAFKAACGELLKVDARADGLMSQLASVLAERRTAVQAMKDRGLLNTDQVRLFVNRRGRALASAAQHAGLAAELELADRVQHASAAPLAETDARLFGVGEVASEQVLVEAPA